VPSRVSRDTEGYLRNVPVVERVIKAPPERVFAVLADGWSYSDWVVGTAHIRGVDPGWPEPGTKLYYQAGLWPLTVSDSTLALESQPPSRLVLRPRLRMLAQVIVRFELQPVAADATRVTLTENIEQGPVRWVWTRVNDIAMHARNVESLRRLADLVERGTDGQRPADER